MHVDRGILNQHHWIKCDVAGRIKIPGSENVYADWQSRPVPWLHILTVGLANQQKT